MTLHALTRLEGRTIESVSVDSPTEVTLYATGGVRVTLFAVVETALPVPGSSPAEFVVATEDGEVMPMRRVLAAEVIG